MKRILMIMLLSATAFGLLSSSLAQSVDCTSIHVPAYLDFSYSTKASFPDVVQDIDHSLTDEKFDFNECGVSVSADGQGNFKIQADSLKNLTDLFRINRADTGDSIDIYFEDIAGLKYPALHQGYFYYSIDTSVDFRRYVVESFPLRTDEAATYLGDAIVDYKVDGGPLLPFWYKGEYTSFKFSPSTKTIDFYAKPAKLQTSGYQRILLDLSNYSLTFWKTYPFPGN